MRAWGPIAALVFAVVLAAVTGARLDAADGAQAVGVVVGAGVASAFWVTVLLVYVTVSQITRREEVSDGGAEGNTTTVSVGWGGYAFPPARGSGDRALPHLRQGRPLE